MIGDGQPRKGAALVVGVGKYPHAGISQLKFAAADAEAISELLADPDVCHFPQTHIATLLDETASRDAIVQHLSTWLPEKARDADVVVLYFAGHGTVCKVGNKAEGYFLAHDADPNNPMARGVAMADVARCMEGLDAAAVVLCLDCCHAGQVMYRDPTGRDMAIRPSNLQPIVGKGRYLLASCDEGQFSIELPALQHGLFTHHLLHGLRGGGDLDGDGKVGVEELFRFVAQAVEADAKKHNVSQRPWMSLVAATGTYLAQPKKVVQSFHGGATFVGFERVRLDDGPVAAVREIEARMATADEAALVQLLKQLGRLADPAAIPALFRGLSNASEKVRRQAKMGIQAVGVERSFQTILELARKPDEAVLGPILDGMHAFDADPRLVAVLDRLIDLLQGDLLVQANSVLEHKRLSLGLETMANLFRERNTGYELLGVLGQGLFAAAYHARDEFSGHGVVVRVLRPEFVQQAEVRKQFVDLCRESVKLVHHNLVMTRRGGELPDQKIYYVVRDYVDREQPLLRDMIKGGFRFDAAAAVGILKQLLAALKVVHAAVPYHGGLKPSNIYVCSPDYRVILGDLAPPAQGVGSAVAKRLAYDYRYAAPEVLQLEKPGPAADIYALGCVAYEMFTGDPPFTGDNYMAVSMKHLTQPIPMVSSHRPDLSPLVDVVLAQMLIKSPSNRATALEVAALLDLLLESPPKSGGGTQIVPPPPPPRPLASYRPIVSAMSIGVSRPLVSLPDMTTIRPAPSPVKLPTYLGPRTESPGTKPVIDLVEASPPSGPELTWNPATQDGSPPPAASSPVPAELLDHPEYTEVRELGRGGMGTVYLARNRMLDRMEVLKLMHRLGSASAENRFLRELRATARLQHPNIVRAYSGFKVGDQFAMSMEFVSGSDLSRIVKEKGPLSISLACSYARQAALGLQHAHEMGMVHRDIKPSNLMVAVEGRRNVVKILDFGLARVMSEPDREALTLEGQMMGTPDFMAPEQAMDAGRADIRADIYSLGATLFYLATGRPPFRGDSSMQTIMAHLHSEPPPLSEFLPNAPPGLTAIIQRMLRKKPEDRFQTPQEVAEALAALVLPQASQAPAATAYRESPLSHPTMTIPPMDPLPSRTVVAGQIPQPLDTTYFQYPPPAPRASFWQKFRRWFGQ